MINPESLNLSTLPSVALEAKSMSELTIQQKWAELQKLGCRLRWDGLACNVEIPPYWGAIGTGFSDGFAVRKAWDYIQNQKAIAEAGGKS